MTEYGTVSGPAGVVLQDELESMQKSAARFITGNYNYETGSMTGILGHFKNLKWVSLKKRRKEISLPLATIHSVPGQNDLEYAPISLYTEPYIRKLLQILIISFGHCAVEQLPFFGCPSDDLTMFGLYRQVHFSVQC